MNLRTGLEIGTFGLNLGVRKSLVSVYSLSLQCHSFDLALIAFSESKTFLGSSNKVADPIQSDIQANNVLQLSKRHIRMEVLSRSSSSPMIAFSSYPFQAPCSVALLLSPYPHSHSHASHAFGGAATR